jgi:hypothetical protein
VRDTRLGARPLLAALALTLAAAAACGRGTGPQREVPAAAARCAPDEGPCTVAGPGNLLLRLEISPRPVRTLKDLLFRLEARRDGRPVGDDSVALDLRMPGMAMGVNRVLLARVGAGLYEGRGAIVRCPSGGRAWEAALSSPSIPGVAVAFEVDRP